MVKGFKIPVAGILTSCFFFPFEFYALPGINTKMVLALLGILFAAFRLAQKRSLCIPREMLWLTITASAVSLIALLSITLNRTPDTTYVSYLVSFFVWLSAAYAVCFVIKQIHGGLTVRLCLDYLVAVCVFQCIAALLIDQVIPVRLFVDRYFALDQSLLHSIKRLYGIGASLDVAGARFSTVLAALGVLLSEINTPLPARRRTGYIIAFLVISVIGNMIARTTLIGTIIGAGVILFGLLFRPSAPERTGQSASIFTWIVTLTLVVTLCVILYNTVPTARRLFRFGFEGFFSLAEKGHWETSSTDKLTQSMVVFPETLHTWLIGDGYFMNSRYDENYLGDATIYGFYMGTDIGYLRFIFYFGIIGLIPMMGVIVYSAVACMRHFRTERLLFLMVLAVGLVVWFKVSTDIFCFFSLFLSAAALDTEHA